METKTVGTSHPLGVALARGGAHFSPFCRAAERVELVLFDRPNDARPSQSIKLNAVTHRTYHHRHAFVPRVKAGQLNGYRMHEPNDPARGLHLDPSKVLLDPYGCGVVLPPNCCRAAAGQWWWQVLPLGATGEGHSPDQALSSFAAKPLILSLDGLVEDGLLAPAGCGTCCFPSDRVDFEKVVPFKEHLLSEDLGILTPAVTTLRDRFQLPGMRVLQFACNGDPNNLRLPHLAVHNGVVDTGTHDHDTTRGWYDTLPEPARARFGNYVRRPPGGPREAVWKLTRLAWSWAAALAVKWRWRCPSDTLTDSAWQGPYELTRTSDRLADRDSRID
jgi:hypothetical protein